MSLKGLRFAGLEWRNITASKVMWVVIAAIAIMPLLYGALYLAAFQDPYARLNTVPVAVVNEDKGAVIAAESRNLGNDVVDQLKDTDDGLQWHFVSADEAQRGLESGSYFMTCTIPADFSESVASVDGDSPHKAQLKVVYNQSENMLASQIGETVWKEARMRVSDTVASEYWTTVLDRVADSGAQIQKAADGAGELSAGLGDAREGGKVLTTKLGEFGDGARTLDEGLGALSLGASALDGGLGALSTGAQTLGGGTRKLVDGARQLKDGTAQLSSGTREVARGAERLQSQGTAELARGAARLAQGASGLPSEQQAAEAQAGAQHISEGIGQLKDGAGRLAGGAAGVQSAAGGLAKGVEGLKAGVGEDADATDATVLGGLNTLSTGTAALKQGADGLAAGIGSPGDAASSQTLQGLLNGARTALSQGKSEEALKLVVAAQAAAKKLSTGAGQLQEGAGALSLGVGAVKGGVDSVSGGLDSLQAGIGRQSDASPDTLFGGANMLAAGIGAAGDQSPVTLFGGLNVLSSGYGRLSTQLIGLVKQAPQLRDGIQKLDEGAAKSDAAASKLVQGSSRLSAGASRADAGAGAAVSGARQLDEGGAQLADGARSAKDGAARLAGGVQDAKDGSSQLAAGSLELRDGSEALASGLSGAAEGSRELATKLSDGAKAAADQSADVEGKSQVMSDPVKLSNEYYTTVKNYGTGFAPYFMALGLWVGCLVAGFVFKPLNKRLIMSGGNPAMVAFANFVPVAFFSLIQATLLMLVLQFGLQLQIDNVPAFYAMGYLTALVFAAIMQVLMAAFGFPGRFAAIILLMLQLTACAGTFPIQTTPDFFQAVNPFMPMTYVVQGMRQVMTGLDYGLVAFDCAVLFAVGAACFVLTCLVAYRRRTVRMDDLHPMLRLG